MIKTTKQDNERRASGMCREGRRSPRAAARQSPRTPFVSATVALAFVVRCFSDDAPAAARRGAASAVRLGALPSPPIFALPLCWE